MAGGVHGFGTEVREPGDEGFTEVRIVGDERAHGVGLGAEAPGEVFVRARLERGDRRVDTLTAEQPEVLGLGSTAAFAEQIGGGVDRVGGHPAVGGEFPARDGDHAARRDPHRMAAGEVGGAGVAARAQQRPQPRPGADDVGVGELLVGDAVERAEQVVDVGRGARGIVERAVVVGVGGADVGGITPRHDEHRSAIAGHGHDRGDVVAHLGPGQRDVDPLGRTDRRGMVTFVERAHVVGPHPCRVHDGARAHDDLLAVGLDACAHDAVVVLDDTAQRGVVRECGTVDRSGAGDGQGEPGVVDLGVVVHVRAGEPVARQRGHVRERSVHGDAVMPFPDADPAGEVVHPECAAEHPGETPVDDAPAREHGDEEREHAHEMRRVLERALPLVERLVDQTELALLEVTQATVDELRALRAGARGEVVAFDQRGPQSPGGAVERHPGTGDATTHDEDVERLVAEPLQGPGAIEGADGRGSHD